MKTPKRKKERTAKAAPGLKDLEPKKSPSGGRAGGDKQKYMEFKLKEVLVSGVSSGPTEGS